MSLCRSLVDSLVDVKNLIEPIDIHTWELWVKLIHHGNNLPKVCPTVHGKNPADHQMDTVQLHNTTSCTVGGDYTPQSCDWIPRDRFETKYTIDSRHQNHGLQLYSDM